MAPKPKILLVDDTPENLVALEALLRREDAELLAAHSGHEALEYLLAFDDVAVALVDVRMPEMDGFELAEYMRGAERTRAIPILFLTAEASVDRPRVFRGYESGGVDFLVKPLEPQILQNKVAVFLELFRQRQQLSQQLHELSRAERILRESDRRKGEFLAILSHELRNPLTPIRNSVYILQRAEPGGEQARRAQRVIERQVGHLARLIDDLLDVTRVTRGKVHLQRERMDLVSALLHALEDHRAMFTTAGVELVVSLPDRPVWMQGDATRIAQIVGNLLGNAAKYTPAGGRVEVSLLLEEGFATVRVRDNGVGIPPDVLDHLFEPFSQADRTLDRSRGGLGLGLALVRGMTELHGGTASAFSAGPGKGAEFLVRLPIESLESSGLAEHPEPSEHKPHRVLIIEDNLDSGDSLREALESMGYEAAVARDGPEGIALAESFSPTVVLCDIGLPGMSGYEVAERLRADGRMRDVTLVAVSGYAGPDDRKRASKAGFSRHLAKPATLEALDRMLAGIPIPPR